MIPKRKRSFYDDYENDSIEIWDAIEEINSRIDTLHEEINVLLKLNGLKRPTQIAAK